MPTQAWNMAPESRKEGQDWKVRLLIFHFFSTPFPFKK